MAASTPPIKPELPDIYASPIDAIIIASNGAHKIPKQSKREALHINRLAKLISAESV